MVTVPSMYTTLWSKYKAVSTLLLFAIRLEQGGRQEMVDTIFRAASVSEGIFKWHRIWTYIAPVFDESSPPSLNRVITLLFSYLPWHYSWSHPRNTVPRWAAAASALPYSEEVGPSVVNALLRVLAVESLRSYIPVDIWAWLKRRPTLPPVCLGRLVGSWRLTVQHVRGLGDIEVLNSYLLLVWSEWDSLNPGGLNEMEILIREDFGAIGMWRHRGDLIKHLDQVQGQLDRGLEHFRQHKQWISEHDIRLRKGQYRQLKNVLLEADKRATETLPSMPLKLVFFYSFTH